MHSSFRPSYLFLVAFLVVAVAGCSAQEKAVIVGNPQFLMEASELPEILQHEDVVILHIASNSMDFESGHIPGARFLNLNSIAINGENVQRDLPLVDSLTAAFQAAGVNNGDRVVLYESGSGMSVTRAFFALDYMGFTSMSVLDGGLNAWVESGGEVETGPQMNPVVAGTLQAIVQPGKVVTADEVFAQLDTHVLLDARSAEEFSGEKPGGTISRGGHIPGALSLDWSNHLTQDGTLKPMVELRFLYAAAQDQPTIVYCRTGMKASHSYFVARYLGLDVSLYDGSFYDWSNLTDYPVEMGSGSEG